VQKMPDRNVSHFGGFSGIVSGRSARGIMPMTKARTGSKRVAIYLRVSTGSQTTANQRRELQAVAKRHGWTVAPEHIFEDNGISGAKGRKDRPALDAMLK